MGIIRRNMKRFSLQTSRITFPIALGVFILLRSILMVCCVLVVYVVYASGNPAMAANFVLSLPGVATNTPISTGMETENATPTTSIVLNEDPTPTISSEADTRLRQSNPTATVLPTETATIQPSPLPNRCCSAPIRRAVLRI